MTRKSVRAGLVPALSLTHPKYPPAAYDDIPRTQITIYDECATLMHFDRGQPTTAYPVLVQDVARALNVFGTSTGLLPEGVLFVQTAATGPVRIGFYLPPARHTIRFDGERRKPITIPLPGFVFVGHGSEFYIWATPERPADEHAELYHAPLPNIYEDGRICVGSVKFPSTGIETIRACAKLFFESNFSYHLVGDRQHTIQFLRRLNGKRQYPIQTLEPATTIGAVLKGSHE